MHRLAQKPLSSFVCCNVASITNLFEMCKCASLLCSSLPPPQHCTVTSPPHCGGFLLALRALRLLWEPGTVSDLCIKTLLLLALPKAIRKLDWVQLGPPAPSAQLLFLPPRSNKCMNCTRGGYLRPKMGMVLA